MDADAFYLTQATFNLIIPTQCAIGHTMGASAVLYYIDLIVARSACYSADSVFRSWRFRSSGSKMTDAELGDMGKKGLARMDLLLSFVDQCSSRHANGHKLGSTSSTRVCGVSRSTWA